MHSNRLPGPTRCIAPTTTSVRCEFAAMAFTWGAHARLRDSSIAVRMDGKRFMGAFATAASMPGPVLRDPRRNMAASQNLRFVPSTLAQVPVASVRIDAP